MENKGESDHLLEIPENLEILEVLEILPAKGPLSFNDPLILEVAPGETQYFAESNGIVAKECWLPVLFPHIPLLLIRRIPAPIKIESAPPSPPKTPKPKIPPP